jgi:serine/threonine protein phosphatase PrpC
MGKSILKIKANSLVYNATANETYKDNVFIDDKYLEDFDISKVQISSDSDTNDVLYALSSGFDVQVDSLASNKFSFMNVLHENYHELKNDEISMRIRMREIGVTIDSAREFITKVNATKELKETNNVSFAGILFSTNKASILNTGKARIYLFRDKYLKLISAQPELVDDIIKSGSLNIEDLDSNIDKDNDINSRYDNSKVLSENFNVEAGDVYILCNEGSSGVISDDNIYEQLNQKDDLNQAISYLVKAGIAGSANKNISMIAIQVQTVPTDVIFSEAAAFVAVNEALGTGKPDSEKNRMISELFSDNDKKPQEYIGVGVPFIGANRYQLDDYEDYSNEKEAKINKNMVAGVIALSLILVALLVMSGMMIHSFSKGGSTYAGIIDTSQPTTEATMQPSSTSTAKPRATKTVTVTTPTVKPKATKAPTPKPTSKPTPKPNPAALALALAAAAATSAVRTAEATPTQDNINTAQDLVTALSQGATKTILQDRIDAVQDIVDAPASTGPTPIPTT